MDPFAALADPVRRQLLRQLAGGSARVTDLAVAHPVSRPAISRHLRVLTEAGLVQGADHGRERHYALDVRALEPVRALLDDLDPVRPARRPPVTAGALDALDTEVRRTRRERSATAPTRAHITTTTTETDQEQSA